METTVIRMEKCDLFCNGIKHVENLINSFLILSFDYYSITNNHKSLSKCGHTRCEEEFMVNLCLSTHSLTPVVDTSQ